MANISDIDREGFGLLDLNVINDGDIQVLFPFAFEKVQLARTAFVILAVYGGNVFCRPFDRAFRVLKCAGFSR